MCPIICQIVRSNANFIVCNGAEHLYLLFRDSSYLDVSTLVNKKKKFWYRGGKDGALNAMKNLEKSGLGKLVVKKSKGSIKVSSG